MLVRVALANTAVLIAVFVLLLATPFTVSAPIRIAEALVLCAGLVISLAINLTLIRRALAPLDALAAQMRGIDLREPTPLRIPAGEAGELAAFVRAFNSMLERLSEERRLSARAALTAQERERLRVGRALHDEAGQTLTAITLGLERLIPRSPAEQRQRLTAMAAQLHGCLDEIRRISQQLRPAALEDLGLLNALVGLSTQVSRQGDLRISRRLSSDLPRLSEELELVIYRVAQEALTNVLRHAEADRCWIDLATRDGAVELAIADDGRGMPALVDVDAVGIEGMRERALLVGGTLSVRPGTEAGTVVQLRVPLESI